MTNIHIARLTWVVLALMAVAGCNLSSDPQSLIARAQAYSQKGDYKAAIIELKNVLQKKLCTAPHIQYFRRARSACHARRIGLVQRFLELAL
jgi:hypothetical protein